MNPYHHWIQNKETCLPSERLKKLRALLHSGDEHIIVQAIELLCSFEPTGLAEVLAQKGEEFVVSETFVNDNQPMWDRIVLKFVSEPDTVWTSFVQQGAFQTMEIRHYSNEDWSKLPKNQQERVVLLSVRPQLIPAGSFQMGISEQTTVRGGYRSERPQHLVRLTQPFTMNAYPCTAALFESLMGGSRKGGALMPVVHVSWAQAITFCNKLSLAHGKKEAYGIPGELAEYFGNTAGSPMELSQTEQSALLKDVTFDSTASGYRLPTEAQWEYVAKYGWSDVVPQDDIQNWAWFSVNTKTLPCVGQKMSNSLGVHDMLGLVWEWVADTYRTDAYTQDARVDPFVQDATPFRVIRGGSHRDGVDAVRASIRNAKPTSFQADNIGFRWVCPLES